MSEHFYSGGPKPLLDLTGHLWLNAAYPEPNPGAAAQVYRQGCQLQFMLAVFHNDRKHVGRNLIERVLAIIDLEEMDTVDRHVVDMGAVVKAITHLEKTQITKEALEETRLGKTVNDIRKRTKNKDLATRCKSLVRLWQKQFVHSTQVKDVPETSKSVPEGSGSHPQSSLTSTSRPPSRGQATTSSVDKTRTENRKRRKPDSPGSTSTSLGAELHPAKRSSGRVSCVLGSDSVDANINGLPGQVSPVNSGKSAFSKVTPKTSASSRVTPKSETKTRKAALRCAGEKSGRPLPAVESKVQGKRSGCSSPAVCNRTTQSQTGSPNVSMPKLEKVSEKLLSKTTASTKVNKFSSGSQGASVKVATEKSSSPGSNVVVAKSCSKTNKKTSTLGDKSSPSVQLNSETLEDGNSSAATVKLRDTCPKLSPCPPAPVVMKQLASSTTYSDSTQDNVTNIAKIEQEPKHISTQDYMKNVDVTKPVDDSKSISRTESSQKVLKSMKSIFDDDSDDDGYNADGDGTDPANSFSIASPTVTATEIEGAENYTDAHTCKNGSSEPLVPETIIADDKYLADMEEEPIAVPKRPITQEEVDRLHNERWEGVNGCYNDSGMWYDWTQCLSVFFNPDAAPLHILPYVDLD